MHVASIDDTAAGHDRGVMSESGRSMDPEAASDGRKSLVPKPFSERDAKLSIGFGKMVASAIAAAFAPVITPVGSAAAASIANQALDVATDSWVRSGGGRAAKTADIAAEESGLSEQELANRIMADPNVGQLAIKVFASSASATTESQLRIFGKILANAVTDSAVVDDELLLATALGPLNRPHFRMLAKLNQTPEVSLPNVYWTGRALGSSLGWSAPSVVSVILSLQASGLVFLSDVNLADGQGGTWNDLENVGTPIDTLDMAVKVTSFGQLAISRAMDVGAFDE